MLLLGGKHKTVFWPVVIRASAGWGLNGQKSCRSGWLQNWEEKRNKKISSTQTSEEISPSHTYEVMTKTLKRQLELDWKYLCTCSSISLLKKSTLSKLTADFQFHLHKWREVWGGAAGVTTNSIWSLFWGGLCSTAQLILNSKSRHLKFESFIHFYSDCKTRRWFEVLTVTSQTPFNDYRPARQNGCFQSACMVIQYF